MIESLYKEQRAQFNLFASTVWGNPNAILEHSGDIEFINLKPYPALQSLFIGTRWSDKILVREEYRIALHALETETYYRGAYVTGQPGIGKTSSVRMASNLTWCGRQDFLPHLHSCYASWTEACYCTSVP